MKYAIDKRRNVLLTICVRSSKISILYVKKCDANRCHHDYSELHEDGQSYFEMFALYYASFVSHTTRLVYVTFK